MPQKPTDTSLCGKPHLNFGLCRLSALSTKQLRRAGSWRASRWGGKIGGGNFPEFFHMELGRWD